MDDMIDIIAFKIYHQYKIDIKKNLLWPLSKIKEESMEKLPIKGI